MSKKFAALKIDGWRQFESINIRLHERLTIITGANGAGKSTLLSFFTRHFGYNRNYLSIPSFRNGQTRFLYGLFYSLNSATWLTKSAVQLAAPQIGELEYSTGEVAALRLPVGQALHYSINVENQQNVAGIHIDSHRPPNVYRNVSTVPATPPNVHHLGNIINNEYINYFANGQLAQGSLYHIKMSLIQMSIFGHGNETMEPFPEFIELFKEYEEILRKMLPKSLGFERLLIRSPEVLLSTRTGDFLIDSASGGVIKLFEIAWQLFFYSKTVDSFVVTFDEPENHLHPSMQKTFLPNIIEAFPQCQIIVVTHSPFIISAIRESFVYVLRYRDSELIDRANDVDDDKSVLGMMGSRVFAERLDTVNKAGTASEILRDVLGISTTIPDWVDDRIREIVNDYRGLDLNDEVIGRLYDQMKNEGLISSYPAALIELTRRA